jgi:hypothetical protein
MLGLCFTWKWDESGRVYLERLYDMEEKAKPRDDRRCLLWTELQEKAKDDPELSEQLEAAKRVMEKYSETLERLADS